VHTRMFLCECVGIYICMHVSTYLYIHVYIYVCMYSSIHLCMPVSSVYVCCGVATISRLLKIIGLFCRI